jgi:DNA (cytosine-5)-methyltransferase 1
MRKALDMFCKAGGATKGLQRAGYAVHGIDIAPQPNYCGDDFTQADALTYGTYEWFQQFDLIWASPPCQAHTTLKVMHNAKEHVDLIPQTREILRASGRPFVIENVVGAPLQLPVLLCGSMFNLGVQVYDGWRQLRRHRLFEANFLIERPFCNHSPGTIGIYGDHARDRRRKAGVHKGIDFPDCDPIAIASTAMGIAWMNWKELSQAIPPAYSEYVARQFRKAA